MAALNKNTTTDQECLDKIKHHVDFVISVVSKYISYDTEDRAYAIKHLAEGANLQVVLTLDNVMHDNGQPRVIMDVELF